MIIKQAVTGNHLPLGASRVGREHTWNSGGVYGQSCFSGLSTALPPSFCERRRT